MKAVRFQAVVIGDSDTQQSVEVRPYLSISMRVYVSGGDGQRFSTDTRKKKKKDKKDKKSKEKGAKTTAVDEGKGCEGKGCEESSW